MEKAAIVVLTMLIAMSSLAAQDKPADCPTITVLGPPGVTKPGEPMRFTATVGGTSHETLRFEWTLSRGKILSGQGTTEISTTFDHNYNLTATLRVIGLPAGCPATASGTAAVVVDVAATMVDEVPQHANKIDKVRFGKLFDQLAKNPAARGYIIEYFPRRTTRKAIDRRLQLVGKYLAGKNLSDRITTIAATGPTPRTKYYLVPPGSDNPEP